MNQSMQLPAQVAGDLVALERRAGLLAKHGKRALGSAGILGVASATAYGLAAWFAPSLAMSTVHLPAELLSLFPEAAQGSIGAAASPFEGVATAFSGMAGVMSAAGSVFLAGGFAMVGYRMAFKGETFSDVANTAVACVIMGTAPMMISWIMGGSAPSGTSARDEVVEIAKRADYASLLKTLEGSAVAPHLRDYVLLQAALVRPPESTPTLAVDQARRLKTVRDALVERLPLSADPKTMYAVETKVAGSIQSAIAKGYAEQGERRAGIARWVSSATVGAFLLNLLAAAGLLGVSAVFRSRIQRVSELLNPRRTSDAKAASAAVNDVAPSEVDVPLPIVKRRELFQDSRYMPGGGTGLPSPHSRPRVRAGSDPDVHPQGASSSFDMSGLAAVALGAAAGLTLARRDAEAPDSTAVNERGVCERPTDAREAYDEDPSSCNDSSASDDVSSSSDSSSSDSSSSDSDSSSSD